VVGGYRKDPGSAELSRALQEYTNIIYETAGSHEQSRAGRSPLASAKLCGCLAGVAADVVDGAAGPGDRQRSGRLV
jgi:hypothetical protein